MHEINSALSDNCNQARSVELKCLADETKAHNPNGNEHISGRRQEWEVERFDPTTHAETLSLLFNTLLLLL